MKNTKQNILLSLTATSMLLLFGCSSKEEIVKPNPVEGECVIAGEAAPSWACGSYEDENRYVDVGSAPISKLGHNFSRSEAMANGRSNLAQQIKVDVKSKIESYMRSSGIKDNELAEKVITQVSRQISKITLEGSKQISYWENKGDNSIYVLMAVDKNIINKQVDEIIDLNFEEVSIPVQQQNAQNALKEL